MPKTVPASVAEVLAAELSAALPARKSALEFERHFAPPDQVERVNRGLFQIRVAEARLKAGTEDVEASAPALASIAVLEAEDLEAEALALEPLLGPEAVGRKFGLLRLVCALFRLARLGEGRSRAFFTYARQGKHLSGFEDALELAPESELFFFALRRFKALLDEGKAWSIEDADWLRLRAASAPGRFRLRAAALRAGAESAVGTALPHALAELREPFLKYGFESSTALAWAVAGFRPKEALVWGEAGLALADQAQAWRDRGLSADEAAAWVNADVLPDEAAAFKACGAQDPAVARSLRYAVGDVEHLVAWHRAGFEGAEVLSLRESGVTTVAAALDHRKAQGGRPLGISSFRSPSAPAPRAISAATGPTPATPVPKPSPPPAPIGVPEPAASAVPAESEYSRIADAEEEPAVAPSDAWAQERAERFFGVKTHDEGSARAAVPEHGGAWMGWGVFDSSGSGHGGGTSEAYTLPLGGGLADVVAESEGVAVPFKPFAPPRVAPRDAWQARLDRRRGDRGAAPQPGQWYLHAWAPGRAWLFWGLVFKGASVPWGQAVDFDSHETWQQRWERKCDEWGEKGLACPCTVGRTQGGGWWIAIKPSIVGSEGHVPTPITPAQMQPAWREAILDFCLKMGTGAQAAQWHLLAGEEEAPK